MYIYIYIYIYLYICTYIHIDTSIHPYMGKHTYPRMKINIFPKILQFKEKLEGSLKKS